MSFPPFAVVCNSQIHLVFPVESSLALLVCLVWTALLSPRPWSPPAPSDAPHSQHGAHAVGGEISWFCFPPPLLSSFCKFSKWSFLVVDLSCCSQTTSTQQKYLPLLDLILPQKQRCYFGSQPCLFWLCILTPMHACSPRHNVVNIMIWQIVTMKINIRVLSWMIWYDTTLILSYHYTAISVTKLVRMVTEAVASCWLYEPPCSLIWSHNSSSMWSTVFV